MININNEPASNQLKSNLYFKPNLNDASKKISFIYYLKVSSENSYGKFL